MDPTDVTRSPLRGHPAVVYLATRGTARYCPLAEAAVPVTDRGLLFGDGVYEVYRLYRGRPFRMAAHLARLRRSAREIRLALPDVDWEAIHRGLVEQNR